MTVHDLLDGIDMWVVTGLVMVKIPLSKNVWQVKLVLGWIFFT